MRTSVLRAAMRPYFSLIPACRAMLLSYRLWVKPGGKGNAETYERELLLRPRGDDLERHAVGDHFRPLLLRLHARDDARDRVVDRERLLPRPGRVVAGVLLGHVDQA